MAKRNPYAGRCTICRAPVRALEGVVEPTGIWPWYRILCPEHMPSATLDPPKAHPGTQPGRSHPLPSAAVRRSGQANTARDLERQLEREWDEHDPGGR